MSEHIFPGEPPPRPEPSSASRERQRPEFSRFEVYDGRPDGAIPLPGAFLVLGSMIGVGLALGFVAGFVGRWFYLMLVYPGAVGAGIGAAGMWAIRVGKVRNPLFAVAASVLAGALAMLMIQYAYYLHFMDRVRLEQPALAPLLDQGAVSLIDFIKLRAKEGISIGRPGQGKGTNLGEIGTYIYWAVELAIIIGLAWLLTIDEAGQPFCRRCNSWKPMQVLGVLAFSKEEAADILRGGDLTRLASPNPATIADAQISAAICRQCGTEGLLNIRLDWLSVNKKGEVSAKKIMQCIYPGHALPVLEDAIYPRDS